MKRAGESPAGNTVPAAGCGGRPVGHRVRRPGRRPGPAGAAGRPQAGARPSSTGWLSASRVPRDGPVHRDRPGRGLRFGDPHPWPVAHRHTRGRPLSPGQAGQRRTDQGPPPASPEPSRIVVAAKSIRNGPTGVACSRRENNSHIKRLPRCGIASAPRTQARRSCRPGSPKKSYAPCCRRCGAAGTHT
jgi:hypothetical protein